MELLREDATARVEDRNLPERVAEVLRVERPPKRFTLRGEAVHVRRGLEQLGRPFDRPARGVKADRRQQSAVAEESVVQLGYLRRGGLPVQAGLDRQLLGVVGPAFDEGERHVDLPGERARRGPKVQELEVMAGVDL